VPYLGYAVETARKPIGFVLLIIIPAVIMIYDEIRKLVEGIKRRKQES